MDNYSDKSWQQIQAESLDFINRLINMIQIYDREKKFDYLHSAVANFQKKFATGKMTVYQMGWHISHLSGLISTTMNNNDLYRAMLAERSNQPSITENLKKYYARSYFNHVWEFYFKDDESAKKAFESLTEENFILVDDADQHCDELELPVVYWKENETEPVRESIK